MGPTVRLRRADNLTELRAAWQHLDRIWPVVALDEAQDVHFLNLGGVEQYDARWAIRACMA